MKFRILYIIALVLFTVPFNNVFAKTVTLDQERITFDAPDGFQAISQDIIAIKYPSNQAPEYVIGNKSAATTIAYTIKPHDIPDL